MSVIWINGALSESANAGVSPFDRGLTLGHGVFETLRVYNGVPFAARRHLERLMYSASRLEIVPPDAITMLSAMKECINANAMSEGLVRLTATSGAAPPWANLKSTSSTIIIAVGPIVARTDAVDVVTVPWPRNDRGPLAGLKTTSYGENVLALSYARALGAQEAIFANTAGRLCEGTGSNVFFGAGGRLMTPPLSSGCLPGVTRELLLELVDIVEEDTAVGALEEAEEAFIASSTREVQPIRSVDGRLLPALPGPATSAASDALTALIARDQDP
jgi:branched-chain amino acid aminotransferase